MERFEFAPRDDRSSKNEPNRVETDRDTSLAKLEMSHPFPAQAETEERLRAEARAKAEADAWAAMTREEKRRLNFIREKAALQAKLGSRIADATGDARDNEPVVDEDKETDVQFAQRMRKDHAKHLREALELYRLAATVLYGVSQVTLHTNKSKVEIAIEGLDIFDPLP